MSAVHLAVVAILVFGSMIVEARRARHNEQSQRARGGVEPEGDVYALMQFAYPGIFLMMLIEGARHETSALLFVSGLLVLLISKGLKWWAILTLGSFWTFRVIVVPGTSAIASGPYKWLRHPNYVAVAGEIVSVALMTSARVTGPLALVLFGTLMLRRISVENRALGAILRRG